MTREFRGRSLRAQGPKVQRSNIHLTTTTPPSLTAASQATLSFGTFSVQRDHF